MNFGRSMLLIICLVGLAVSCDREERDFRVETPSANPVYSVQLSELIPGTQPSTQPAIGISGFVRNSYEENAYAMSQGQRLYMAFNCAGCHANGGGGMGPPLMDRKWAYGSNPEQVFSSIVQGRPNGMPAWGSRIPEYQIWQLVAYVRSMSGLASAAAAPSRSDHMKGPPPPNTVDPRKPTDSNVPKSAEMPQ
jgi:cytochrome c oxidase cbb3-type subunit III